jgi:nucleotide-binding universal stress UspA family protein
MPYKTILVHVDHSRHAEQRFRAAATLALQHDAHLIGAAMSGVSRFVYEEGGVDVARTALAMHMEALFQRANAALAQFEALATSMGVRSFERRLVDDEPEAGMALQARYADLVVLSQHDPDDPVTRQIKGLAAYVMLTSARPVLVVPHAGQFEQIGREVLIAWDNGSEATRALSYALPLLQRAAAVTLVLFNPVQELGVHAGADMALYLARHGVKVELLEQHIRGIDVGNALLSLAADRQSDLIVMGGYGHARLRELLLGGVTETILHTMTAPVLMAH